MTIPPTSLDGEANGKCEHELGKRADDPEGFVCYKCGAPYEVNMVWPPTREPRGAIK